MDENWACLSQFSRREDPALTLFSERIASVQFSATRAPAPTETLSLRILNT